MDVMVTTSVQCHRRKRGRRNPVVCRYLQHDNRRTIISLESGLWAARHSRLASWFGSRSWDIRIRHATAHAGSSGHHLIRSFEPGEEWFWSYQSEDFYDGPELAAPQHHPIDQPTPGPAGRVPADWQSHLH